MKCFMYDKNLSGGTEPVRGQPEKAKARPVG